MNNCKTCNKEFKTIYLLKQHLRTKKHINNVNNAILNVNNTNDDSTTIFNKNNKETIKKSNLNYFKLYDNKFLCMYCNKEFKNNRYIKTHVINTCHYAPVNIKNKLITLHNTDKKTTIPLNKVNNNNQNIQTVSTNINYGTITNNIYNIKFNYQNKDDPDYMSIKDKKALLISDREAMKAYYRRIYSKPNASNDINNNASTINIRFKFINKLYEMDYGYISDYIVKECDNGPVDINKLVSEYNFNLSDYTNTCIYKELSNKYDEYYNTLNDEYKKHNYLDISNPYTHIKLFKSFIDYLKLMILDVKYIIHDKLNTMLTIKLFDNKKYVIVGFKI